MYSSKLVLLLLFLMDYTGGQNNNISFIQHPISNTFCEGDNGVLSCVVEDNTTTGSANNTAWVIDDISPVNIQPNVNPKFIINNTRNGNVVTSVLTIQNLSSSDNGNGYFCSPVFGIRSITGVISVIAPPMTPPTINGITPLSSTSFTVDWTITDPNHNYIITWTTGMMEDNMTVPENTNSYNVTGLNGIDNYNVSIAANNSCGMMMSDPMTVYDAPNAAPMNIVILLDDITRESFVVGWDAVMDLFDVNYTIRWYEEDGINRTDTVNRLSYTVTGLTANTSYNVTVVAINTCCGAGPVSNVTMTMTNNEPPTSPPISGSESTMFSTATSLMTSTPGSESTMFSTATSLMIPTSLMTSTPGGSGPGTGGSGSSSNTGAIAGGVIGGVIAVIVVVIIIIVVYMCFCRHKDSTDRGDKQELKSPTGTGGSHTASVKPASNVPHQTAASGEEYAVTTRVTTTKLQQQPPTQEYAVVDKGKKHAAATQGIHYADLQDLPGSGSKPPTNQDPTLTYAMVA